MSKKEIVLKSRFLLFICLVSLVIVGLLGYKMVNAGPQYYYDVATIYDMNELSEGKSESDILTSYTKNSLGTLPTTDNIAVMFNMTMPSGTSGGKAWNVKQGFLNETGTCWAVNGSTDNGYMIYFRYGGENKLRIQKNGVDGAFSEVAYTYATGDTKRVEIGAVNVYSDATKNTKVGRQIYLKLDSNVQLTYLDLSVTAGDVGRYVATPVLDAGNVGGKISKVIQERDKATVYDMSQLSESKLEDVIDANYVKSLGEFPEVENVAVSFTLTKPTGLNWNVKHRFLNDAANNHASNKGYYIYYHYQGKQQIRIDAGDGTTRSVDYNFAQGATKNVEVGAVNVYADAQKQTKLGREVYVKIDGVLVLNYFDTSLTQDDIGAYVSSPVVDGTFTAGSGSVKTGYYIENATVYDMFELSEKQIEKVISGDYTNSLGALPTIENTAVRFVMTKPTGLNWNVKHCFLNTTGMSYNNAGGYYIYYHYQGSNEIRIESLDGTGSYSKVAYDWNQGTSKQVEVGSVNVYTDAQKQTQIGRQIYVMLDGTVVLRHLDMNYANASIGSFVSVPVVDGTFKQESGKVQTTYEIKKITPEIITEGATGSGSVDTVSALVGHKVVVSVKPNEESVVEHFYVNDVDKVDELKFDTATGKYTYQIEEVTSTTSVKVKFKKSRYFDEVTVFDMNDLSEEKIEEYISGNYDNSLGLLSKNENVAVRFKMTKPTGLNWNVKQCFLNTSGKNYSDAGGYYIYYHYQGSNEIRIVPLDGSEEYSRAAFDFAQGSTKQIEIGIVNVYEDAEKQKPLGREVYVCVDNQKIVSYFDKNMKEENLGMYVSSPVVDGSFTSNSGKVKTTYNVIEITPEIVTSGATGTGTVENISAVVGKPITIRVKPSLDSVVEQLLIDGVNQANKLVYEQATGTYTYRISSVTNDMTVKVRFKQAYWFDKATVYDMSQLENGKLDATVSGEYRHTLGKLKASENVGVKFYFTKPTGLNWNVKQSVFNTTGFNYSSDGGYYVYYHYQGVNKLRIEKPGGTYVEAGYEFALGDTKQVEVCTVNVYSDQNKKTKVGIEVYVKIDGEKILSYLDLQIDKTKIGPYVSVPVVDGTLKADSGIVKTTYDYYFDKATIYDMSDLSELKVQAEISSEYKNSLGYLKTSENVGVKFHLTKPTGLNWNVKQCFLNTTGNNYSTDGGYYIYYHYQGQNKIRIEKCGQNASAYSEVNYAFGMGETKKVEVGRINIYSDAAKKTKVATEIYVKIDDVKVLAYIDYDLSAKTVGKYISVPVVDGTLKVGSGSILTTYPTISITPEIITSGATGTGEVDTALAVVGKPITISVKPAKDSTIDRLSVNGKNCLNSMKYDSESGKYIYTIQSVSENTVVKVRFHKSYWFDNAKVYDMAELSEEKISVSITGNYKESLGTLPSTENVAVKYKLTKPTGLNWNLKNRFLTHEAGNHAGLTGYYIYYHYQGKEKICIQDTNGMYSAVDYEFAMGETKIIEIGAVNVYSDAKKETKVGRLVYVKIDGAEVAYYLDTTVTSADVGNYVAVPVVDGTFTEESGKVTTTYRTYDIVVLDGKKVLVQKTVIEGKNYDCKIPMKKGEAIKTIRLNGRTFDMKNVKQTSSHMIIPLEKIRENKTFSVNILRGQKVSISINDKQGCEIELPKEIQIRDELCFDIKLPIGKTIKDIFNNGISIKEYIVSTGAAVKIRIPVVYEDVKLSLELEDSAYTVKINKAENGTIKANAYTILAHDKLVLTCSASEGYMFEYVKVNGEEVFLQPDGTYVIETVQEDIEVTYSMIEKLKTVDSMRLLITSGTIGLTLILIVGVLGISICVKRKKAKENE